MATRQYSCWSTSSFSHVALGQFLALMRHWSWAEGLELVWRQEAMSLQLRCLYLTSARMLPALEEPPMEAAQQAMVLP